MGPRTSIRGNGRPPEQGGHRAGASMGPRTSIRGNVATRTEARPLPVLPRFNGAADFHPRKPDLRALEQGLPQRASMGPRTSIRGNEDPAHRPHTGLPASMGPRTSIRGNASVGSMAFRTDGIASMGPRTSIRGNPGHPHVCSAALYGFNGAADFHPRKPAGAKFTSMATEMLQWGRGLPSAETRPSRKREQMKV